ncbi:MAG: hypothetical protein SCK29_12575 [Bacillota bacterium]|nr:hypothetical protein [Bacillota bacterium]MDW7684936.1 hypothetical protein [Bacillota bacterium]
MKQVCMKRRGVPRDEYLAYFRDLGGKETEPGYFTGPGWTAEVGEVQEAKLFNQTLHEVDVTISAAEDKIDEMVHAFRIKFLRAGA